MRGTIWIIGILIAMGTSIAFAQAFGEGVLNAVSYRPITTDMTIRVQSMDNSDENLMLVDEVTKSLATRGYQLSDDGNMVLTVETRSEIGAWSTTDRRHVLEIQSQTNSHSDQQQVKLNLFNSQTGGILNKGESGTTIVTPSQYVVEISIDNANDGKRHWQAWAAANLGQSSSIDLMRGMIPALCDVLGTTVSQQTFQLQ